MKSVIKTCLLLTILVTGYQTVAQTNNNHKVKESDMITTVSNKETISTKVYFVDTFIVPDNSFDEFVSRMAYNRNFIKDVKGFIKDEVLVRKDSVPGKQVIMTIAVWQDQESLDKAKELVMGEYKRIGFNPNEFCQQLNITMKRQMFTVLQSK